MPATLTVATDLASSMGRRRNSILQHHTDANAAKRGTKHSTDVVWESRLFRLYSIDLRWAVSVLQNFLQAAQLLMVHHEQLQCMFKNCSACGRLRKSVWILLHDAIVEYYPCWVQTTVSSSRLHGLHVSSDQHVPSVKVAATLGFTDGSSL